MDWQLLGISSISNLTFTNELMLCCAVSVVKKTIDYFPQGRQQAETVLIIKPVVRVARSPERVTPGTLIRPGPDTLSLNVTASYPGGFLTPQSEGKLSLFFQGG